MHHLLPLTRGEVTRFARHPKNLEETLFAGGYPRIFDRNLDPVDWLRSYVATYLERDVRTISNVGDLTIFQRFVEFCAGRTAQLLNYSSLAKRLRHFTAERKVLDEHSGGQLYRLPPAGVSRNPAQAAREDAETVLLRHRPGLLASGYPYAGAASIASTSRLDL